jgi:hypothetical protein
MGKNLPHFSSESAISIQPPQLQPRRVAWLRVEFVLEKSNWNCGESGCPLTANEEVSHAPEYCSLNRQSGARQGVPGNLGNNRALTMNRQEFRH